MKSILFVRPEGGIIEFTNPAPRREPAAEQIVFRRSDGSAIVFFRKYNPYHDRLGRFASADGAGGAAFRPAKTQAEAEQYARQELGFWEVDFGDHLDMETINHINEQIHAVQEKYPELKGAVQSLRTAKLEEGAYAQTLAHSDGDNDIEISSMSYGRGLFALEALYAVDVKKGYHPAGTTASSIIWHEYGHILAAQATMQQMGIKTAAIFDPSQRRNFINRRRNANIENEWLNEAAQKMKISAGTLSAAISRYAKENGAGEAFAEAFAEVNCSKSPRGESVELMKISGYYRK